MTKWYCIVAIALLVAGCGGGGGSSPSISQPPPVEPPPVEPAPVEPFNAVLFSDLLFSGLGYTNERVEHIECTAELSQCTATFRGVDLAFSANPTAEGEGTAYTSLGAWNHMHPVVVEVAAAGLQGRMAAVSGRTYADSLPALGSATWQGEMFALDPDNRLVRGGATLTIDDLATPVVDVELTPAGHAAMTWEDLPVTGGGFSARGAESDYIKGEFYGREAQEVGGVFERNRLLGAFGAAR